MENIAKVLTNGDSYCIFVAKKLKAKIMSYTNLLYHIVIRTYRSQKTICEEHEKELYAFMLEICRNRNVTVYRIGGMPDHIHLFVGLPSTLAVSKFVQALKSVSSFWLKNNPHFPDFIHWSKEYAAFTYYLRERATVVNYIVNQKAHHKTQSFEDEYRDFVTKHGVEINEQYFLKD